MAKRVLDATEKDLSQDRAISAVGSQVSSIGDEIKAIQGHISALENRVSELEAANEVKPKDPLGQLASWFKGLR